MSVHQLMIQFSSLITWSSQLESHVTETCCDVQQRRGSLAGLPIKVTLSTKGRTRSDKAEHGLETFHEELISACLARLEGDPRAYKGAKWSENRSV